VVCIGGGLSIIPMADATLARPHRIVDGAEDDEAEVDDDGGAEHVPLSAAPSPTRDMSAREDFGLAGNVRSDVQVTGGESLVRAYVAQELARDLAKGKAPEFEDAPN
jgi:hypothetical protein